jgi:hypothetical protein
MLNYLSTKLPRLGLLPLNMVTTKKLPKITLETRDVFLSHLKGSTGNLDPSAPDCDIRAEPYHKEGNKDDNEVYFDLEPYFKQYNEEDHKDGQPELNCWYH